MAANSGGLELIEKYKRLAVDYAKIKGQLTVVKDSVKDEQSKRKKLDEELREKELSLRKAVQENEALCFRNQQLSKRVTSLQQDLTPTPRKNSKEKDRATRPHPQSPLQDPAHAAAFEAQATELAKRVTENDELRRELQDVRFSNERTIQHLQAELEEQQRAVVKLERELSSQEEERHRQVEEIQTKMAVLQGKLDNSSSEVQSLTNQLALSQQPKGKVSPLLSARYRAGQDQVHQPQLKADAPSNRIEQTVPSTSGQSTVLSAVKEVTDCVGTFCSQLTNYHSYLEQRLCQYGNISDPSQLTPINQRFLALLRQSKLTTRPLQEAAVAFSDKLSQGEFSVETVCSLSSAHSEVTSYTERLLPFHQLSVQEEMSLPSSGQKLQERNMSLLAALPALPSALASISSYLAVLASAADSHEGSPNAPQLCRTLAKQVQQLYGSVKSLLAVFTAKVTVEYQLPVLTQKLKTTNECILSSLNGMSTAAEKMSSSFQMCAPLLPSLKSVASDVALAARSTPELTPSPESLPNWPQGEEERDGSATEHAEELQQASKAMKTALEETQKRATKLEEEKEQLLVETQLLKMKLEREQKGSPSHRHDNRPGSGRRKEEGDSTSVGGDDDSQVSEGELVQKHFAARVAEQSAQLQLSDSRCAFLATECQSLQKHLANSANRYARLELDLEEARQRVAKVEDESRTLSHNYEQQLSVMSDHVCSLNDQLLRRTENAHAPQTGGAGGEGKAAKQMKKSRR